MKKINDILYQLLGDQLDTKIKHYFISGAYKSILLQATIAIITFVAALLIAHITGDRGFGIYTTVFTWVSIIGVGATLGLDDLVLKQIPIYKEEKNTQKIRILIKWVNKWGLMVGCLGALALLAASRYTSISGLYQYTSYYEWAVWCIPLFVLMHVNQAILRGLKLMWWGQLAEKFVQPLAFFLLLLVMYALYRAEMTDMQAVIARTGSFIITALVALFLLYKYTKPYYRQYTPLDTDVIVDKQWMKSCSYFAATSLLYIINTRVDILMLGFYEVIPEQIAYYNAALKLSDIALIPFAVLYTVTAPVFSELYAKGEQTKLQAFFTKTTRLACLAITFLLLFLVIFGEWCLGLFGASFRVGYEVLVVFCLIKFIHVAVGPVNYLMMMVGLEKEATYILLLSVGVTLIAHTIFIPLAGIKGAAYATLIGLVVFEVLVTYVTYRKSGIFPTIVGRIHKKE